MFTKVPDVISISGDKSVYMNNMVLTKLEVSRNGMTPTTLFDGYKVPFKDSLKMINDQGIPYNEIAIEVNGVSLELGDNIVNSSIGNVPIKSLSTKYNGKTRDYVKALYIPVIGNHNCELREKEKQDVFKEYSKKFN